MVYRRLKSQDTQTVRFSSSIYRNERKKKQQSIIHNLMKCAPSVEK